VRAHREQRDVVLGPLGQQRGQQAVAQLLQRLAGQLGDDAGIPAEPAPVRVLLVSTMDPRCVSQLTTGPAESVATTVVNAGEGLGRSG